MRQWLFCLLIAIPAFAADDPKTQQIDALQGLLNRESQCRDLAVALLQTQGTIAQMQAKLDALTPKAPEKKDALK
jgi:hypothetical protein